jgi:hypothetical protein
MNAVSGTILVVLLIAVCFAPRRWALLAMMAGVFFLTQGHSVDVAGVNVYPIRFIEVAAFGRVLIRRELTWSNLNQIDVTFLLLYNYAALIWILRSPTIAGEQFASALDPTLCYLALRALVGTLDDLAWFLNAFVVLLVPFTALVFVERLTNQSAFTVLGATWELYMRDGVARAQGTFRHAILLGSIAATFLSLYMGLWLGGTRRAAALLGSGLCLSLVIFSNSGGPLTSAAAVFLGWSIWPLRNRMAAVRGGMLVVLLLLLGFMKAPIWYLPFKISALVGGGGYHRGLLMERAWDNLDKWWLAGMDIRETASWFPYVLDVVQGADVTNQFLSFGLRAGLPALALCIALLSVAFRHVGMARASIYKSADRERAAECLLWGLGVMLFVQAVTWLGVSYFDQSYVVWLMQLAALSAATQATALRAHESVATASDALVGVKSSAPPISRKRPFAFLPRRGVSLMPNVVRFRRAPKTNGIGG